jgi:hypothetical protein
MVDIAAATPHWALGERFVWRGGWPLNQDQDNVDNEQRDRTVIEASRLDQVLPTLICGP